MIRVMDTMSIYFERCDLCRDYRPILTFREGRTVLSLCLRCAYLTGKLKFSTPAVATVKEDKLSKISRVLDEITGK